VTDDLQTLLDSIFILFQLALALVDRMERLPGLGDRWVAEVDVSSVEDGRRR